MAKSTKYHNRDRVAMNVLRNLFPTTWLFKNPRDNDSGREYSEDGLIEIVHDDEQPTGIEFGVQNKTNVKVTKTHVSMVLSTNDIKRLMNLRRPVLLHAHDMKSKTSYWRWLPEWYANNFTPTWDKQKTVAVQIPLSNVLNEEAVRTIRAYAGWDHEKRQAEKIAELANLRHGKDFKVTVHTNESSIFTIVNPLHDRSVPTVIPLDEAAQRTINLAQETGLPVPLAGSFAIQGAPDILHESGTIELSGGYVWTRPSQEVVPLKIDFLGENDVVLFRSPFVQMKVLQPGTVKIRLQGKDEKNWVTYAIAEDSKENTRELEVRFECKSRDAMELQRFFDLTDRVKAVQKYRITHLDTDPEYVSYRDGSTSFKEELTPRQRAIRLIVKALALIQTELGIKIQMPETLDNKLLKASGFVNLVILEGYGPLDIELFVPPGMHIIVYEPIDRAQELVNRFEQHGRVDLYLEHLVSEINVDIADHNVTLGKAYPMFQNCKIANIEPVKVLLAQDNLPEDTKVQIGFEPDRDQGIWLFQDWPRDNEN